MGQTLTNGIFLPNEGERNCYNGLEGNWRAIDGYIGNYNVHVADTVIHVSQEDRNKWDAVTSKADASALTAHTGNTTIHVTAEDKTKWDAVTGKADASALTAHTGDSTIHVTAADKTGWNGHVANGDIHVTAADKNSWNGHVANGDIHVTAADKTNWNGKADDTGVMHLSGDESSTGNKNFVDNIIAKKIVSNTGQLQINAKTNADSIAIIAGASATEGGGVWVYGKNSSNRSHVAMQVYDTDASTFHSARLNMDGSFTPTVSNNGLGSSSFKWRGFNSINPGALSLPNLSAGVDISGYFTTGTTENTYTPTVNGWVCIHAVSSITAGIYVENSKGFYASANSMVAYTGSDRYVNLCFPVIGGESYNIVLKSVNTSITAKFFPCAGNV